MLDIATILAEMKVKALSLSAKSLENEMASVNITITVKNSEQLENVIRRLNRISGVRQVSRSEN